MLAGEEGTNRLILYLCNGSNEMIQPRKYGDYAVVMPKWRHSNPALRRMDRVLFRKNFLFSEKCLGNWSNELYKYDVIIIEALAANAPLISYLINKKEAKGKRIVLWHWNKVFKYAIDPNDERFVGCELWSFDPNDCDLYGMKFNSQYFDPTWTNTIRCEEIRDAWFIGTDKGRKEEILYIKKLLENNNMTCEFRIIADKNSDRTSYNYSQPVTYEKSLQELAKSKIILDVPIRGQSGLTLRPLEAMFFKKKLITTNLDITSCGFYRKENIFVIGKDDIRNIQDWIALPFNSDIEKELLYYSVGEWLKRFEVIN